MKMCSLNNGLVSKRGFATQEEAEQEGLIFARKWIDDGKPKLRERGTGGGS
jgi:hypothetical protein